MGVGGIVVVILLVTMLLEKSEKVGGLFQHGSFAFGVAFGILVVLALGIAVLGFFRMFSMFYGKDIQMYRLLDVQLISRPPGWTRKLWVCSRLKRVPVCEDDRDTIQGAIGMMRAKNAREFSAALEGWRFPSANIVIGDREGNIGYKALAAIPVRSHHKLPLCVRWISARVANTPRPRHSAAMKTTVELDASNRIVLSRELRRAAGISRRQKLIISATPGRIVLEMEPNVSGRVIKRGKLKVWTGAVPATSIEEAVDQTRHYSR